MANVSTNGIRGCAAEISNVISVTSSLSNKVQEACNDISSALNILNGYNGLIVKGTREDKPVEIQGLNTMRTYANVWQITKLGSSGNVETLFKLASEATSIISNIKSQVSDIDGIASAIDNYINSINTQLSEVGPALLTSDMLSAAYLAIGQDGVAKANLATSGEDINNRNFINYSDIKDNGLANTKLSFVLQDDGSYKIYSNDKETEFYTTGLAAAFYQKSLKRAYDNAHSSTKSESGKSSDNSVEFKDGSNVVVDKDIKESVKKEIAKYSTILISSRASEADKKQAYNNLSTEAKSIVDGKIKVLSTEEGTQSTASSTANNSNIDTKSTTNLTQNNTIEATIDKAGIFRLEDVVKNKSDFYLPEGTVLVNGLDSNGYRTYSKDINYSSVNGLVTFNKNNGYYEYYTGKGVGTKVQISPDDLANSYIQKQETVDKMLFYH